MSERLSFNQNAIATCLVASFASAAYAAPGDLIGSPVTIGSTSYNTASINGARISADPAGNQVATWVDYPSGNVLAQRLSAAGAPSGSAIQVAAAKPPGQGAVINPAVAINASGQFVVVWTDEAAPLYWQTEYAGYYALPSTVHARTFQADGTPISGDIQFANLPLNSLAVSPAVAIDDDGDFVAGWRQSSESIIWEILPYPVAYSEWQAVYARVYSATGKAKTGLIKLDSGTATKKGKKQPPLGHLDGPVAVGMDGLGNFTVAWQTADLAATGTAFNLYSRSYASTGVATGAATIVNQTTVGESSYPGTSGAGGPAMAMNRAGQSVLTWSGCEHTNSDGSVSLSVCARIFQPGGLPAGNEFSVNADLPLTYGYTYTWAPVAIDQAGNFIVASNLEHDNLELVRLFAADGTPRSGSVSLPQGQQGLYQSIGVSLDSQGDAAAIYLGLNSGTGSNPVLLQAISGN